MADERCAELRDEIAELALGIASGDDRSRVLEHTAVCPECRRLLDALALLGDGLLRLAPRHEPPPGFEVRVLERLGMPRRRPRRGWSRAAVAVAAAVVAAALATAVTLRATSEERRLGAQLEAVFATADGRYFGAEPLRDGDGRRVGRAFIYGGVTPWVFVALERPLVPGRYELTAVTRGGRQIELGARRLGPGDRALGTVVRLDLRELAVLLVRGGGEIYAARFPPPGD